MNHSTGRLWGIDLIAAVYGLATLIFVWLCFSGNEISRAFGIIMTPICATLCLGIAFRVNFVRVLLMVLLGIALVGDVLLIAFFVGQLADLFQGSSHQDPIKELVRMPIRLAATLGMFFYLRRPDVRDAFNRRKVKCVETDETVF